MGGGNELFFPIISQKEIHSGQEGDHTLRYLVGEGWRSLRTVKISKSDHSIEWTFYFPIKICILV